MTPIQSTPKKFFGFERFVSRLASFASILFSKKSVAICSWVGDVGVSFSGWCNFVRHQTKKTIMARVKNMTSHPGFIDLSCLKNLFLSRDIFEVEVSQNHLAGDIGSSLRRLCYTFRYQLYRHYFVRKISRGYSYYAESLGHYILDPKRRIAPDNNHDPILDNRLLRMA